MRRGGGYSAMVPKFREMRAIPIERQIEARTYMTRWDSDEDLILRILARSPGSHDAFARVIAADVLARRIEFRKSREENG